MVTGSTAGTALSNSGTAHVKGGYSQLVASSPFDATGFILYVVDNAALTGRSYLIDIAVGAAASEQVIVPNLLVDSAAAAARVLGAVWIPLPIPSGSRISARMQNSSTTGTVAVGVVLMAGGLYGMPTGGRMSALGADTATSNGVAIDPGAVAHTKGSYSQLTASTTHDIRALILAVGSNKNTAGTTNKWLVDIAIGAAASEQVLISNLLMIAGTDHPEPSLFGAIPCVIPVGTRVSVRAQCSITDATDRKFAIAAYGIG